MLLTWCLWAIFRIFAKLYFTFCFNRMAVYSLFMFGLRLPPQKMLLNQWFFNIIAFQPIQVLVHQGQIYCSVSVGSACICRSFFIGRTQQVHPWCLLGACSVHPWYILASVDLVPGPTLDAKKRRRFSLKSTKAPRPRPKATQEPPTVLSKPPSSRIFYPRPFKGDRSCFLHGACGSFF